MPIHKFVRKPVSRKTPQHLLTVQWKPKGVMYKPEKQTPRSWKMFCQEQISIQPKETKLISLSFGVEMSEGMVFVSLKHDLKQQHCSIHNETILESLSDILITLQNNSEKDITISQGQELCIIHYIN